MANITAVVHSTNSAKTLEGCLDSLKWAEHVLVIDMESSDDSVKIAKTYKNVTVLSHKNLGFVEPARNFALQHVRTEWTLILDADEEISSVLAKQLQAIANESTDQSAEIYFLPRRNMIFGAWIAHTGWWPDHQLRFFKTGAVTWPAEIHAQPTLTGESIRLPADPDAAILHHNYQTIEQFIDRLNRYTSIEVAHGRHQPRSIEQLPSVFSQEFCRRFFVEQGYQDGYHGLTLSYLQAMYQLAVTAKHWQAQKSRPDFDEAAVIANFTESLSEQRYWLATYHIDHSTGITQIWWRIRRKLGV